MEGMLLEKPVVYPAIGSFIEYMTDGETGLSYPPGDVGALVSQIEQLVGDPERRYSLGKVACAYALQRFTRDSYGGTVYRALTDLRCRAVRSPGMSSMIAPIVAKTIAASCQRSRARIAYNNELESCTAALDAVLSSHSWRLTAPMRWVGKRFPWLNWLTRFVLGARGKGGALN